MAATMGAASRCGIPLTHFGLSQAVSFIAGPSILLLAMWPPVLQFIPIKPKRLEMIDAMLRCS